MPVIDPIARFRRWFADAHAARLAAPEAMAVATVGRGGRPGVRILLLKQADARGFVFFTNAASRKGEELRGNPRAAAVLHWKPLGRQVRIEGTVEEVTPAEADAYWATRPRGSQLGALASRQSAPLVSRAALLERWDRLRREYRGRAVPRPSQWTGYRLVPESIEFWTHRARRLHHRELYVRGARGWRRMLLQP